jgi:hypothetical protein
MNAGLVKRISPYLLLPMLALAQPFAHAQASNNDAVPLPPGYGTNAKANLTANTRARYEIEIVGGYLSLAPLKGHTDIKAIWAGGPDSVPATIGNLAKYLRAQNPELNIVLSPGAADEKITDLKLRSGDMKAVTEAVIIATESKVRSSQMSGNDNWTFVVPKEQNPGRTVEVFNLSGYIQTLNANDTSDLINLKLDELKQLIRETLQASGYTSADDTSFRYHPGTHLLIVTGSTDAIDITRKIVNALSGQPRPGAVVREDLLDVPARRKQN